MSFCPTNDIHSLYVDNEMPAHYVAEYEAHIKSCEKCRTELERLRAVHNLLKADSDNISLDEKDLDESYKRLVMKMSYSKNTRRNQGYNFSANLKYIVPVAAAAAIMAVVLPVRSLKSEKIIPQGEVEVATVQNNIPVPANVSFNNERGVIISGNIHDAIIPVSDNSQQSVLDLQKQRKQNKKKNENKTLINEYEVFRPAFSDEKTISIRITVPGMDTAPITTEIELPVEVLTGYSE